FFGRMISGHVHLLSILSWGILVYQTSMSFFVALHFTTRDKKKPLSNSDKDLFFLPNCGIMMRLYLTTNTHLKPIVWLLPLWWSCELKFERG
ncbi:hypothetical protein, partial [Streptococcus hyointestinalis]|uniref:hypothetical protein n=1 Tax=Streptococcus hyointestinalis TaxID=1337 RepID=UPI003F976095